MVLPGNWRCQEGQTTQPLKTNIFADSFRFLPFQPEVLLFRGILLLFGGENFSGDIGKPAFPDSREVIIKTPECVPEETNRRIVHQSFLWGASDCRYRCVHHDDMESRNCESISEFVSPAAFVSLPTILPYNSYMPQLTSSSIISPQHSGASAMKKLAFPTSCEGAAFIS